jgi:TRAP-type transport system small permease protein
MSAPASSPWLVWPDRLLNGVAGAFVVVLLGTVTAGIVSRALNRPLSWTDEACGYLMVWLACLGWMIATRTGMHIRIRVFLDKLPTPVWRGTEIVVQVAIGALGGVLAWYSIHLIRTNADIEAMALPVSTAWMYVPLLPAGLLTLAQALADLWALAAGRTTKPQGSLP